MNQQNQITGRISPANSQNIRKKLNSEMEFQLASKGFLEGVGRLQIIAIFIFFVLALFTQILPDMFDTALLCYRSLIPGYMIALFRTLFCNPIIQNDRQKIIYRIIETGLVIGFLSCLASDGDRMSATVLFSILLTSYLLRMIYSYRLNQSKHTSFINTMNRTVLLLRAFVFVQAVLVLVQLNLEKPITWFAVLVPTWIFTAIILIFTVMLIKNVSFTYKIQFWKSDIEQKKRVARWVFGNLFALLLLLVCISLLVAFVFDGYISMSNRPFLAPFLVLVLWCIASLIYVRSINIDILKFFQELRVILDENGKKQDKKIKYVIKISNAYFKPAKEQDIKQLKSQSESPELVLEKAEIEVDVEAGLKEATTDGNNCIVCCKNVSDAVFMGCGHGGICFECGKEIIKSKNECHMCREKIDNLLKMNINPKNTKATYYKIVNEIVNKFEPENGPLGGLSFFSYLYSTS